MRDVSPPVWNESIRKEYSLDENSVVVDLGAFRGDFSQQIFDIFKCNVIALEPISEYFSNCATRFAGNPKIRILNFGIGSDAGERTVFKAGDASSQFSAAAEQEVCKFLPLSDVMKMSGVDAIDLMKVNIEGGEYALLENLVQTGLVKSIKHLQVQFHSVSEFTPERLEAIRESLKKTHQCDWRWEPMTWESWSLIA